MSIISTLNGLILYTNTFVIKILSPVFDGLLLTAFKPFPLCPISAHIWESS